MAVFQSLNQNGITIILVTHESDIARYASRIVIFRDGEILSDERVSSPIDAKAILSQPTREPS